MNLRTFDLQISSNSTSQCMERNKNLYEETMKDTKMDTNQPVSLGLRE